MADTFFKAARLGKSVYPVTESIDQEFLLEPPEFSGHWDPHVWMDVVAWSKCVEAVREALTEEDPDNGEYYRANCQAYLKKLTGLHQYVKNVIASIPQAQRVLITAHDAFNYFARAYGIEVRGVQGISRNQKQGLVILTTSLISLLIATFRRYLLKPVCRTRMSGHLSKGLRIAAITW